MISRAKTAPLTGARILDRAEGVLVGLRRYPAQTAFDEIVSVSRQWLVSPLRVAQALVELAEGRTPSDVDAGAVAVREWGGLLREEST